MGTEEKITGLAEAAERQILDGAWDLAPHDRAFALDAEAGLSKAVGPPRIQELLSDKDRRRRSVNRGRAGVSRRGDNRGSRAGSVRRSWSTDEGLPTLWLGL